MLKTKKNKYFEKFRCWAIKKLGGYVFENVFTERVYVQPHELSYCSEIFNSRFIPKERVIQDYAQDIARDILNRKLCRIQTQSAANGLSKLRISVYVLNPDDIGNVSSYSSTFVFSLMMPLFPDLLQNVRNVVRKFLIIQYLKLTDITD